MRAPPILLLLLLALAGPASAVPREEFFQIDQPLWLGLERLTHRLQSVRSSRPIVALHLSGGSARAFAHLGVLQRLEEDGLRPDLIVTNSMGSVVGLLYAAGVPLDVIEDLFFTVDFAGLFTAKLPTAGGVADLRGLLALLHALAGEADIAALPLPVIAVCEDLRSMRKVLLAEGELGRVLQAAIAMPALFEPVDWGRLTLIDGGVTNLAPLAPFWPLADAHIASTAFYTRKLEPNDPLTVFNMAINISKSRTGVEDIKEFQPFLIRCDVEEFTYMGWHQLAQIRQRGYDSCSQRLAGLRQYLESRGVPPGGPPRDEAMDARYRSRWAAVKQRLAAGQRPRLDRGFGALQVHPLLLKRYGEPNRLVLRNYAAASYLYEAAPGGFRAGLLSDAGSRVGAFLGAAIAGGGGFSLRLDNYAFSTVEELGSMTFYHLLRAVWPLPIGSRLALGPFLQGELEWEPGIETWQAFGAAGARFRLAGRFPPNVAGSELSLFFYSPDTFGLATELLVRQRVAGPVHIFARGLLRQAWSGTGGIAPTYNDFFRGIQRGGALDSFAVINSEAILSADNMFFTVWEAAIIRNLELAVYCDLLWEEAARFSDRLNPAVGVSLRGDVVFAGLLPLSLMLSVGYDLNEARVLFTLNLGAPY